jgi:hypothetical protein
VLVFVPAATRGVHTRALQNVIRGASKGRQLRYQVHPLLVNFAEPRPYPDPGVDLPTLLASLFQR